jgi:hypothetical protein
MGQQTTVAQETQEKKAHELNFYGNLHDLALTGISYKSEINNGTFIRIGATNLAISNYSSTNTDSYPYNIFSVGGGIQAGLEKRIVLTQKLSAFYGVDITTSVTSSKGDFNNPEIPYTTSSLEFVPGFTFGSGFIFSIFKNFSLALNIEPAMLMRFSSLKSIYPTYTDKANTTIFQFRLDIDDIKLSLVYRW